MRPILALAFLMAAATTAAAQTAFCPYGQTCQKNTPPVPFPVINPVQGLNNVPNLLLGKDQPPPPAMGYAPVATPPPVLPPDLKR